MAEVLLRVTQNQSMQGRASNWCPGVMMRPSPHSTLAVHWVGHSVGGAGKNTENSLNVQGHEKYDLGQLQHMCCS